MNNYTTLAYVSPVSGQYYVFEFDTILKEGHTLGAEVSDHPVEAGANISDHVRPDLSRVELTVAVSNTPLNQVSVASTSPGVLRGAQSVLDIYTARWKKTAELQVSGGRPPLTDPFTGFSVPTNGFPRPFIAPTASPTTYEEVIDSNGQFSYLAFDEPMNRTRAVFEILDALRSQGIPLELSTDMKHYPQMLITSLKFDKDGTTGVELQLSLREFVTATTQQTQVKRRPAPKKKPVEKRAEANKPKGKDLAPTQITPKSSVAKKLAELLAK